LRLRKGVSVTETEDGAVLLDQRSGRYFQLNASGLLVLSTLLAGGTAEQAADAVVARYPVEGGRALADVRALVESLRAARLVVS
jgi:Coenzyme PQQ synthesis protein D (PqqD)